MLPAARLERAGRLASSDPLSAVPARWKPLLSSGLRPRERVIPAEIIRLPAQHLSRPETMALLLRPGAVADSPTAAPSAASRQLIHAWLDRQPAIPNGSVRPVLLLLEQIGRAHV